jgi:hypothetical protein
MLGGIQLRSRLFRFDLTIQSSVSISLNMHAYYCYVAYLGSIDGDGNCERKFSLEFLDGFGQLCSFRGTFGVIQLVEVLARVG